MVSSLFDEDFLAKYKKLRERTMSDKVVKELVGESNGDGKLTPEQRGKLSDIRTFIKDEFGGER